MFEDQRTETQMILPRLAVVVIPALLAVSSSSVARWVPLSPESPFSVAGTKFEAGCAVGGFPTLAMSFCRGTNLTCQLPLFTLCDPLSWLGVGRALFKEQLVPEA